MKYVRQGQSMPRPDWGDWGDGPDLRFWLKILPVAAVVVALLVWVFWGGPAFTVAPDEEGVVLTFGKYTATTQPGLHFKWPWPIQTVEKVRVGESKRLEVGFRAQDAQLRGPTGRTFVEEEARMLTGDENIVDAAMVVQYRIKDPLAFLFNFQATGPASVEGSLDDIAEAALRQAVGDHPIDDVLTTGKVEIQNEILDTLQAVADSYRMGVQVTSVELQDVQPPREVADAFLDVATAREDREEQINRAMAYAQDKLPRAQGEAARLLQVAQGYRQARIAEAEGAIARFKAISEQYTLAPEVTRTRLYLEAMNELLPKVRVRVIDGETGVINLNTLGGAMPPIPPRLTASEARAATAAEAEVTRAEVGGR